MVLVNWSTIIPREIIVFRYAGVLPVYILCSFVWVFFQSVHTRLALFIDVCWIGSRMQRCKSVVS